MHINKILTNYLYDSHECLFLCNQTLYVYGVKNIILITNNKIELEMENQKLFVSGNNLKIVKSDKKELLINGEIHELKK